MAQLTVYNPDGSIIDTFAISDTLGVELTTILEYSRREYLDLALLKEIEVKVLSVILERFAISNIYYFSLFLEVISRIEKLPNSDSLKIFVEE